MFTFLSPLAGPPHVHPTRTPSSGWRFCRAVVPKGLGVALPPGSESGWHESHPSSCNSGSAQVPERAEAATASALEAGGVAALAQAAAAAAVTG